MIHADADYRAFVIAHLSYNDWKGGGHLSYLDYRLVPRRPQPSTLNPEARPTVTISCVVPTCVWRHETLKPVPP